MTHYSSRNGGGAGDRLMDAVRNHPEGLLLVIAGCALLMRGGASRWSARSRPSSRPGADDQAARYAGGEADMSGHSSEGSYISQFSEKVADHASSYASSAASYAGEARDVVTGYAGEARDAVTGYAGEARDVISDLPARFSRLMHERPLGAALAGFAAGAAVAAAFPPTDMEKRTLGMAGERLATAAGKAGEEFKKASTNMGERVMSEGVKGIASDVAEAFGDALMGETSASSSAASRSAPSDPSGKRASAAASKGSRPAQVGQPGKDVGSS